MNDLLARHKTLLLDMDGTLLDLAYDNHFWLQTMPAAYAEAQSVSMDIARDKILSMIEAERGTLNWYCLDFWSDALSLDVLALKSTCEEPIQFLAGAPEFLKRARSAGHELIIVTNSSPELLKLKDQVTQVTDLVDAAYSSGEFEAPKESPIFWERFAARSGIRKEACLLVDDSPSVLQAGVDFGLGGVIGINHPDSKRAPNALTDWPSVDGVKDLLLA
ncbi:MAG: HAD family hydrolase [Woeseiaceae bacterium]